jgi:hypothetical protein
MLQSLGLYLCMARMNLDVDKAFGINLCPDVANSDYLFQMQELSHASS